MPLKAVIMGPVEAVRDAFAHTSHWAGFNIAGAALIGTGDSPFLELARVAFWEALDIAALDAQALILAEPPADGVTARALLERAAEARMKMFLLENGAPRGLR